MSIEAWTIIGTGITLAALQIALFRWLRVDIRHLETRMIAVEKEQARVAGLLEGLGLIGRATPGPGADRPGFGH